MDGAESSYLANVSNPEDANRRKLRFAAWAGCIVTILACLVTCMAFIGYKLLKNVRTVIQMGYLSSLAVGQISFIVGLTMYSDVRAVCTFIAVIIHFSCLSSVSWMLCLVLQLASEVRGLAQSRSLSVAYYLITGALLPLIVVLISVIARYQDYTDPDYCWPSDNKYNNLAIIIPLILLLVASYAILVYAMCIYKKRVTNINIYHHISQYRTELRACFILIPLLGATWLLSIFMVDYRDLWLQITFSVSNVFQGITVIVFMLIWNIQIIQKRKGGRGFFPKSAKEKMEKLRIHKEKRRRKSISIGAAFPINKLLGTRLKEGVADVEDHTDVETCSKEKKTTNIEAETIVKALSIKNQQHSENVQDNGTTSE